jgi:hypothetical protein
LRTSDLLRRAGDVEPAGWDLTELRRSEVIGSP